MRRRQRTLLRERIARDGYAVAYGSHPVGDRELLTHYTVGLTRYEDHPEIIVVGACCSCAEDTLEAVVDVVRSGTRLGAGWALEIDGWRNILIGVDDPLRLTQAQDLYRIPGHPPVPALQLVGADEFGELPWESGIGTEVLLGNWVR